MHKRTKQLMSILNKIDIVLSPKGSSPKNARYVGQMNQLINAVHSNKIVAIWSKDVAKTLTQIHDFGPARYFSVPVGGAYYYIVKWYASSLLTNKPK